MVSFEKVTTRQLALSTLNSEWNGLGSDHREFFVRHTEDTFVRINTIFVTEQGLKLQTARGDIVDGEDILVVWTWTEKKTPEKTPEKKTPEKKTPEKTEKKI